MKNQITVSGTVRYGTSSFGWNFYGIIFIFLFSLRVKTVPYRTGSGTGTIQNAYQV